MFRRTLYRVIACLLLPIAVASIGTGPVRAQDMNGDDGLEYAPVGPPDGGPAYRPDAGPGRMRGPPPPDAQMPDRRLLPPRAIIASLARRGFSDARIKRVRGESYIVVANSPDGGRVLLVVDGQTTEITGLRQIGWDRPPRQWDDDGWPPARPWGGPRW